MLYSVDGQYFADVSGYSLFWDAVQNISIFGHRDFGTAYRSQLHNSSLTLDDGKLLTPVIDVKHLECNPKVTAAWFFK
jgi:hypothetical protein